MSSDRFLSAIEPPRMTTTQRDTRYGGGGSLCRLGMMIFNTTIAALQINIAADSAVPVWVTVGGGSTVDTPAAARALAG